MNLYDIHNHNRALHIPAMAIKILHSFEQCRLEAYLDGDSSMPLKERTWTIGWGNTYYADGSAVKKGDTCTQHEADAEFEYDLDDYRVSIIDKVNVILTPNQLGALICLAYNIGMRRFSNSTLLKMLNNGDFGGAAEQFKWWRRDGGEVSEGLVRRRLSETQLFCGVQEPIIKELPDEWLELYYP